MLYFNLAGELVKLTASRNRSDMISIIYEEPIDRL